MLTLSQPLLVKHPEPKHELKDVITMQRHIDLLKEEEDYWPGEQHNTKLMITRLRKIFYDQWGWNTELIRGAASVQCRYEVKIIDNATEHSKPVMRYKNNDFAPKHREVVYRSDDRVYGNTRAGQSPFIYKTDHQEVVLTDGYYCDAAHILAGLDAHNHLQVVTPLPPFFNFLKYVLPHVDSNVDIVTWLGDIASSASDFLILYLRTGKSPVPVTLEQKYIEIDAPGSDMLGDVEPYVIAKHYDVSSQNGIKYTEILTDYYFGSEGGLPFRSYRISEFCKTVGLKNWDGEKFSNEQQWLQFYRKQLRDNTCFQVFSLTVEGFKSLVMLLRIWFNGYKDVLKLELLLEIWLKALKENIKLEPIK